MSDIIDLADAETALHLKAALSRRKPGLPRTGQCHNCEARIGDGVFCDADCSHDYERRQANRRVLWNWCF